MTRVVISNTGLAGKVPTDPGQKAANLVKSIGRYRKESACHSSKLIHTGRPSLNIMQQP
jgi:hypothetical protein